MSEVKFGVQLHPQHTTMADMRRAWRAADELGVDSITTWDHFFPLYGDPQGAHFEGWTTLAAMAADTERAQVGILVTCNSYRNPDLLADMARTVDQISQGRTVLGVGAGWSEHDYREYGYDFATAPERLRAFEESLRRIKARLAKLNPPPLGRLPILIGGGGEKVTLRLVATYADMWNSVTNDLQLFRRKQAILDSWCGKVGRDPRQIERSVLFEPEKVPDPSEFIGAGAGHLIVQWRHPFSIEPIAKLREHLVQSDREAAGAQS